MSAITKIYGLASYGFSMVLLVVFILFANNDMGLLGMGSYNIDGLSGPPSRYPLLVNLGLILLFGLQHSVLARPAVKRVITTVVPVSCERSTYVLTTGLVLLAMVHYWQPMNGYLWSAENPYLRAVLTGIYYSGWLITFLATFMLNHLHLFGLQQSFKPQDPDAGSKEFKTPLFYRLVRHPIQTGVVIAMVATPDMSVSRAVLAAGMLTYVAVGLYFEERDLIVEFGDTYREYKRRVPAVLPSIGRR